MQHQPTPSAKALLPLVLFLLLFFGFGLYFSLQGDAMGFYHMRAPIAILPAIALALWLGYRAQKEALNTLLKGMGEPNIMLMALIFLLAGAFASVSRQIGGVDAAVYLGLTFLPASFLLPGVFIVSSLISLAMGTSMGTIAAVAPIAIGFAQATDLNLALTVGAVVGGAMFGDNLSVISDTTIAATRTQGAQMSDKFKQNVWIALPAALLTVAILWWFSAGQSEVAPRAVSAWLALPYLVVLILAVAGMNVLAVLTIGIVCAGITGIIFTPQYSLVTLTEDMWKGFEVMTEITLLSILVGGLAALMRSQGGLTWLAKLITKVGGQNAGPRTGELGIAALSSLTNLFTANNTISILISGPVAKDLADSHGIHPARSASILDIFSCVMQGLLPYGAQILLASSLSAASPLAIAANVFYCWMLGVVALGFIATNKKRLPKEP
ncbi:MAG: Na+/H+ antiporter NhaC family protein [Venatoribacter sp.]